MRADSTAPAAWLLAAVACGPGGTRILPEPPIPPETRSIVAIAVDQNHADVEARGIGLLDTPIELEVDDEGFGVFLGAYPVSLELLRFSEGSIDASESTTSTRHPPVAMATWAYDFQRGEWRAVEAWPGSVQSMNLATRDVGDVEPAEVHVASELSCVLLGNGELYCWGSNSVGQLGSPGPYSVHPRRVVGVSQVTTFTLGHEFGCGIELSGQTKCWGNGNGGQLGRGDVTESDVAAAVSGLPDAAEVAASLTSACALTTAGEVYCWGANRDGSAGTTEQKDILSPQKVHVPPASRLFMGSSSTCVLTATNETWCWGANGSLQLGRSGANIAPGQASDLEGAIDIGLGSSHGCARLQDGDVKCWGSNREGQLGSDGDEPTLPVRSSLSAYSGDLLVTGEVSCVRSERELHCVGKSSEIEPEPLEGLRDASQLASEAQHGCAVRQGELVCWGWNGAGQLGFGESLVESSVVDVPGVDDALHVLARRNTTCVRRRFHPDACFGANALEPRFPDGQGPMIRPRDTVAPIDSFSLGSGFACTRTSTSSPISCYGSNDLGQLGRGTHGSRSADLISIPGTEGALTFAAGGNTACAVWADRTLRCWGSNEYSQLGTGDSQTSFSDRPETVMHDAVLITVGSVHTCTGLANGEVWCWGYNSSGQLGIGEVGPSVEPAQARVPEQVIEIAASDRHTCVRTASKNVYCFGRNDFGESSESTDIRRLSPSLVENLGPTAQIGTGEFHTCARLESGEVHCFGSNAFGQMGLGTTDKQRHGPNRVPGIEDAISLAVGTHHACVVRRDGRLSCWGRNSLGQLGTGKQVVFPEPRQVEGLPE